ncbi:MAG: 4a-hydroxytetrahydrobiopterin dehydratase [Anaerolineae bacterium]|nr:4a-hydroxytetrahydrobiopterin dehydratase [Anaerolineae bacterium]
MIEQECRSLRAGELPLTDEQIEELKRDIFGWDIIEKNGEKRLRRLFKFRTFAGALQFATIIGEKAEAQGHYPKLTVDWVITTVEWWTPELGGLHPNDFIMAAKTDDVYDHWFELTGRKDVVEQASEQSFPASDPPGSQVIEGG